MSKNTGKPGKFHQLYDNIIHPSSPRNDPVDLDDIAETVVLTQQSKVLHANEPFWTDKDEFARWVVNPLKRSLKTSDVTFSTDES
jgi:hypothetical protein